MKGYKMRLAKPLELIKMLTMKVIITMTLRTIFASFTDFGKFKKMTSLGSKRCELIDFFKLFRD